MHAKRETSISRGCSGDLATGYGDNSIKELVVKLARSALFLARSALCEGGIDLSDLKL